MQTQTLFDF